MKKIFTVILTFVIMLAFAGCANTAKSNGNRSSKTSVNSENNLADEDNISKKEVSTEKKMLTMNITIGNSTFTAILEDNDTAKALVNELPLTVDMSELNGNEKYNYLQSNLRANTASSVGTINEGDLMLYGDNCLVLFYKTFNTSYSYVKIGHIDNTTGLEKSLGSGSAKVTFSISD